MTTPRKAIPRTVFARIPMGETEALHVAAETDKGRPVIDLRVYAAATPAKVMMSTRHAVTFSPAILPALIDALQAAASALLPASAA